LTEEQDKLIREMLDQIQHEPIIRGPKVVQAKILEKIKEQSARIQKIVRSHANLPSLERANDDEFLVNTNCFAYALNLWEKDDFYFLNKVHCEHTGKNIVNSNFIDKLIQDGIIQQLKQPSVNNLIIYFDTQENIKHAGIVKAVDPIIVESKWGEYPVLQHALWHVPRGYGICVGYYQLPPFQEIDKHFKKWIK
jgi:hypothetical protein